MDSASTATRLDRLVRHFVVQLDDGVWLIIVLVFIGFLTGWQHGGGDPPRTLRFENAKRFTTKRRAVIALEQARQYRPFRRGQVYREDRQPVLHQGD